MKIGIVGLPNVGKSTLFNALTRVQVGADNYPFCTIDPNIGVVAVPDERLEALSRIYHPEKKTPTVIEFVDIAGLVKGASQGEGLGNQFLAHIREVDAVAQVVRCFQDSNVTHVNGEVDPVKDIEIINTELMLADLVTVEKRLNKKLKEARGGKKEDLLELAELEQLRETLEAGRNIRELQRSERRRKLVKELQLLTAKPVIYVCNIAEGELASEENQYVGQVREFARNEGAEVVTISARIEADIAALEDGERELFLQELGIEKTGLDNLIKAGYHLLDLITFLTAGKEEVRAWTVNRGSTAPQAAGKIHSDMERGFIRAEVVGYEELLKVGSTGQAREEGLLRLEGKNYLIQDGDVCYFRFNV